MAIRRMYAIVWVVLDNSGTVIKKFRYHKLEMAEDLVKKLEAETGIRHYIQKSKDLVIHQK